MWPGVKAVRHATLWEALAQIGSTLVVFAPFFWKGGLGEGDVAQYVLASIWEVPCFRLTEGDGHARLTSGSW